MAETTKPTTEAIMSALTSTYIPTPHGTLHVHSNTPSDPSPDRPALLMIHGNSTSTYIFAPVFASALARSHQLLALDLPGHGRSSDAPNPPHSYTQTAYADAALRVLSHLRVPRAAILGWSLGGHVAVEAVPRAPAAGIVLAGVMLVGTPPLPRGDVGAGFAVGTDSPSFRAALSAEELDAFARGTAGAPFEAWMRDAVGRTDGRARGEMYAAMAGGRDSDQRGIVEGGRPGGVRVAVVNGAAEPFVRLEYVRGLRYARLWRGECVELDGLGHAPFWEAPAVFLPYLEAFLRNCEEP